MEDTEATIARLVQSSRYEDRVRGLELIMKSYSAGLKSWACKKGVRFADADDVVQETMAGIWGFIRMKEIRSVRGFVFGVLRRKIADHFEDQRKQREGLSIPWDAETGETASVEGAKQRQNLDDPASNLKFDDLMKQLAAEANEFPTAERATALFVLEFYIRTREWPTAADVVQNDPTLTEAAAQRRLWRVRQRFQEGLEGSL